MADGQAQVKRTTEIEEVTNRYFIHPLSRIGVTYFARWGIRPNAVSLFGMVLGAGAAAAYYHYEHWPMALLGFLLMIGWHIMDGADGQLARLTGQTSEMGKVLDGLCDHITFALVYFSLALALTPAMGLWVWILAALAGLSHVVQASAYEFQRQSYDFWVHDKPSARPTRLDAFRRALRSQHGLPRLFGHIYLLYLKLQYRVAVFDETLQAELAAALREADDEARIRNTYRMVNRGSVRQWGLLSSNYRTLAIFLACLAGRPVAFFVFEIVLLNAGFVLLMRMQRRRNGALRTWLSNREILQP